MGVVLIAEDEEALLDIYAELVEGLGHRAVRAHDGEEALLLARTAPPNLVISDHMMPKRTGIELLRALREDDRLGGVPFLLLSAARPRGLEEADRFLAKPVDLETFESAVTESLGAQPRAVEPVPPAPARLTPSTRDEMLDWVAHEIKTPLTAARAQAQLLLRKNPEARPEDVARHAASILRQLDRMNALVTSILDAARLSDGRVRLEPSPGDLAAFLTEAVAEWREQHPGIDFALTGVEEPVPMAFDAPKLRQIADNLVSNAVKYGGRAGRVAISLSLNPGLALVSVRDWGAGIPASEVPNVFDRFHRADETDGRGHGLGLYIASALARLHGGSLAVLSEIGEGSTFTLRLPLRA